MPVRSLNSSVLKWPSDKEVLDALKNWVRILVSTRNDIVRIGYFGSYANEKWSVGSDLDVIIIIRTSAVPFYRRLVDFDLSQLPVPADLLVYTKEEFEKLRQSQTRFRREVLDQAVWVYPEDEQ